MRVVFLGLDMFEAKLLGFLRNSVTFQRLFWGLEGAFVEILEGLRMFVSGRGGEGFWSSVFM